MELTNRLRKLTTYVEEGMTVADVGCDHGYISIDLIKSGRSPRVLAMDVNKDPLEKAKANAVAYNVAERIGFRLSNGLDKLEPGEVDCIIIAGMGGKLVETILDAASEKLSSYKRLILSPHRDVEAVRAKIRALGFPIVEEDMLEEEGHDYNFIIVDTQSDQSSYEKENSDENLIKIQNKYGKLLIEASHPLLKAQILRQLKTNAAIIHNLEEKGIVDRVQELNYENELGKKVLSWME